jgi:glycosyltransferase involved in cell wall biosynthesis
MAIVYGQSKIVFNASINGDVNMRVFEAMAAGALLVTDRVGNGLSDLFEEDTHYIGYSTISEALEKIGYFLDKSEERENIAHAGQQAVLEHHTYGHRWEFIRQMSDDAYGHAPARSLSQAALGDLYAAIFVTIYQPWRISQVCRRYGINGKVAHHLFRAWGRWVNARIPLTPNAIKTRLLRR